MLQAEGSALLFDLPQELSLGPGLPEVPVLPLVLPILEHTGKQLEQLKRTEPTAPAVSCAVTVQELGRIGIPVIGSSVQPTQCEGEIPLDLLEEFAGVPCRPGPGDEWRGNFFHCGDETPSPRWGAWSDVGAVLDFHQPGRFGVLRFA